MQASVSGHARPMQNRQHNGPVEGQTPLQRQQSPSVANSAPAPPQERAEAEERLVVTPVSNSSPKAVTDSTQPATSSGPANQQVDPRGSQSVATSSKNEDSKTVEEASSSAPADAQPLQVGIFTRPCLR